MPLAKNNSTPVAVSVPSTGLLVREKLALFSTLF